MIPRPQSVLKLLACFCLVSWLGASAQATVPRFVEDGFHSSNAATVAEVVPSLAADVVILEGGLNQGIRLGMVCRVSRGAQELGELIVIDSIRGRAAALILSLKQDSSIQPGDRVRVKTIQNS
ncbi:MAG: hypothetical protein ACLFU4_02995 [Opitutales bacterium]